MTSSPQRPRLLYVLPYLGTGDSSHMAHVPPLLEALGAHCDIDLLVQRSNGAVPPLPGVARVHVQAQGGALKRVPDLWRMAWRFRRSGGRVVFVRISVSAALALVLVAPLLRLKVFYWQSGQSRNFLPSWRSRFPARLRVELEHLLQRSVIRLVHRFVTGPERMAMYYARHFGARGERTVILYNDVSLARLSIPDRAAARMEIRRELGLGADTKVVLFVGRVSPLKGGHHLPALAAAVRTRCPQAVVVALGTQQVPIDASVAGDALRLLGPRANDALGPWFAGADVFCLPSESEGFPRVVAEAMAYALPIVAFDVGGVRDLLPEDAQSWIVPRGDVAAMADRIIALMDDPALHQQTATALRVAVERFDTPRVADMYAARLFADESP